MKDDKQSSKQPEAELLCTAAACEQLNAAIALPATDLTVSANT